jgi:hypothetical protein
MKKNKLNINVKPQVAPVAAPTQQAQQPVPQAQPAQKVQQPAGKTPSVMILVPAMEMVNAEFAQHLAMAAANMVANGIKINCAFNIGSVITIARRNLTDIFLKSDFDYAWWVDSDMKFPIDAPIKLLKRGVHLVGANYRRRRFPNPGFTGMMGSAGNFTELVTDDNSPPMQQVDVLPHGMMLVHRSVYEKIPQPHYLQDYVPEINLEIGEDIYFCNKAKQAGFEVWVDHDLSKEIAHIGIFHFNYNLSVPQ